MYTASFVTFIKANKDMHHFTEDDQIDLMYRALFFWIIQGVFVYMVLFNERYDLTYKTDTMLNIALFFSVMILHWMCVPEVRSGIHMMKYALCKGEDFTHPNTCFFVGMIQVSMAWLAEIGCIVKSLD